MKIRTKEFFSSDQKEKIRRAVQAAEGLTATDISVMLVDESDRYREAELLGALSLSALAALVLSMALRYIVIWFYIPLTAVLFFPFMYLFRVFPHMKLAFLHRKRVEDAVRERAIYAFFQKGVHKTDEQTGILIFISLLERKVWILADKGIHGKIGSDFWRTLAAELAAGIKEGHAFEALSRTIEKCGAELARHFPGAHGKNPPDDDIIC